MVVGETAVRAEREQGAARFFVQDLGGDAVRGALDEEGLVEAEVAHPQGRGRVLVLIRRGATDGAPRASFDDPLGGGNGVARGDDGSSLQANTADERLEAVSSLVEDEPALRDEPLQAGPAIGAPQDAEPHRRDHGDHPEHEGAEEEIHDRWLSSPVRESPVGVAGAVPGVARLALAGSQAAGDVPGAGLPDGGARAPDAGRVARAGGERGLSADAHVLQAEAQAPDALLAGRCRRACGAHPVQSQALARGAVRRRASDARAVRATGRVGGAGAAVVRVPQLSFTEPHTRLPQRTEGAQGSHVPTFTVTVAVFSMLPSRAVAVNVVCATGAQLATRKANESGGRFVMMYGVVWSGVVAPPNRK